MIHLKLAAVIIIIVIALVSGFFSMTLRTTNEQEARLRCVEERQGRIDERLKNIEVTLMRIEGKLK